MKLMINHQTYYQYTEHASQSIQYIKMTPQSNEHQQVHHWNISVPGQQQISRDVFSNIWITNTQNFDYRHMMIMAQGVVEIDETRLHGVQLDLSPMIFLQTTATTLCSADMLGFVRQHVPNISLQNLRGLSAAILSHMPYSSESTLVTYSARESFAERQGVCQDHSHVFIAMCRALGVPARYVSGYLHVPDTPHLASHAWAEAWIDGIWHCFDVSNQLYQPSSHIYVAIGRDYWDVAPVRGVRAKGGDELMSSIVQVLAC
ncbi:transglutaminase family protein [Acinetobacter sp. WZC-1]|uniref:transglutaminase family protein n=1 Tax=Acinetobacter sp. WZC-1 TaxID=3459034 RepID=UPI00403E1263